MDHKEEESPANCQGSPGIKLLDLAPELILKIMTFLEWDDFFDLEDTCSFLKGLVEEYKNSEMHKEIRERQLSDYNARNDREKYYDNVYCGIGYYGGYAARTISSSQPRRTYRRPGQSNLSSWEMWGDGDERMTWGS